MSLTAAQDEILNLRPISQLLRPQTIDHRLRFAQGQGASRWKNRQTPQCMIITLIATGAELLPVAEGSVVDAETRSSLD